MNVGSSILLLALLTLGGTPADGEILEDVSGLATDEVTTETNTETKDPQELHGSVKDDEVPILLRMFPGGEYRSEPDEDVGKPLIFNNSKLGNVKDDFLVKLPELAEIAKSYAGYITINKEYNSNLFFWYFEAKEAKAPVVMWLQGGPGDSSMFGLFVEHGPYVVTEYIEVEARDLTWANGLYHVVYVDQPVGAGFSFADNEKGYATGGATIAANMYEFIQQFLDIFSLRDNDLYVTGEDYAAKLVPDITWKIHWMNRDKKGTHINLKGLAFGAGMTDPCKQMNHGEFLYQIGLVDEDDRKELISMHKKMGKDYVEGRPREAVKEFHEMTAYYEEKSGLTTLYNYIHPGKSESFTYYPKYINQQRVREAIHVGNQPYNDVSQKVYQHMVDDILFPMSSIAQELLIHKYKVMIFSGQLDGVVPYPRMEQFISDMYWWGQEQYQKAERKIWIVDGEVAGYTRKVLNLWEVMVRNAGHILPFDQPKWSFDMFNQFIEGTLQGGNSSR